MSDWDKAWTGKVKPPTPSNRDRIGNHPVRNYLKVPDQQLQRFMSGVSTRRFKAADVPDIRDEMQSNLAMVVAALGDSPNPIRGYPREDEDAATTLEICNVLGAALTYSDLWWASSDITDLVSHAWASLPPTTMTFDLPPSQEGLILFDHTVWGTDAERDTEVGLHALQWYGSLLTVFGGPCISITAWQLNEGVWTPLGRSDWPLGRDSDWLPEGMSGRVGFSVIEDRKLLATIWLLARQHRITEMRDLHQDRAAIRRYERRYKKSPPRVRMIDVRAPQHGPSGEGRKVEWRNRWLVSGHWRQQAYGPGRQYRRPTWIEGYVKGPADKPMKPLPDEIVKKLT